MVLQFIVLRATSFTGIMRNLFKHTPFSFDRLWQFRGQIDMFENLKMAAPLVAILAPETSFYLVVIYIELPFHSLCKQFIIITVVFIGFWSKRLNFYFNMETNIKIRLICYKSLKNHLEDIGTICNHLNLSSKLE